jgi:hypothetical protein
MIISSKIRRVGMLAAYTGHADSSMIGMCRAAGRGGPGKIAGMPAQRDPLSEWFDAAAIRFLHRAYANRGEWTGVYLAPPTVAQRARVAAELGYTNLTSDRDKWGEVRWVRAFKRSVYWHLKKFGYSDGLRPGQFRASDWPAVSLEWQTGARVLKKGWPSRRWSIRISIHPTGRAAHEAAKKIPARERWIVGGVPTDRQSTVTDRDW